ncbi:MAG: envelope stress response membrane protein PspC [Desulfobacteraceae bacterium]|nr:envelope stress response membrane protein PspC [Desulfobacteraceae bacterium]
MSRYYRMPRKGLYRSRDGIILGVCRGVADYLDVSAFWIRAILIVVFIFTGFWPVIGIYILAAFLMKSEPGVPGEKDSKRNYQCRYNRARRETSERIRRKWGHLEKRIRRMEDKVTSREFDWKKRFYG